MTCSTPDPVPSRDRASVHYRSRIGRVLSVLGVFLMAGGLLSLGGCGAEAASPALDFRLVDCPEETCVVATLGEAVLDRLEGRMGEPEAWSRIAPVFTAREAERSGGRPVLGRYRREGRHELIFSPRLPLVSGRSYTVRIRWNGIAAVLEDPRLVRPPVEWRFRVPGDPPAEPPEGISVEPGGNTVPMNLLRIHLGFERSMRSGGVNRHVRLVSSAGNEIDGAFVPVAGGLWGPKGRRLTLLLDPGGSLGEETGKSRSVLALRRGEKIELVVDGSWLDRSGVPVGRTVRKGWEVTGPDREAPDSTSWSLGVPTADGKGPLRIDFHDLLDAPLLRASMEVVKGEEVLPGRWVVRDGGRAAAFLPDRPWAPERHRLHVGRSLEDLAGNPIQGPRELEFRPGSPSRQSSKATSARL